MQILTRREFLWIFAISIILGAGLSFLEGGGWLGFSFLFLLSLTLLKASHEWSTRASTAFLSVAPLRTKTLGWIIALAFVLRLAGGVAAYTLLPVYGYADSKDNRAGYTYTDARKRDEQAWGLAISGKPIVDAFGGNYSSDQYGGLLALSALTYRYLSPDAHRPLMMVLLAAFVGALGVPFLWRAARQPFGEKAAWASAWIFALYPESVLLGSSAMREPYLITLSAIALWGFVLGVQELAPANSNSKLLDSKNVPRIALGFSLLGMLLLSPAVAVFTLIIFAGWIFFSNERAGISWKPVLIFAVVFIIGLFVLSSSLDRKGSFETTSPLAVLNNWLELSVKWNVYQIERESGWVQKLFDEMPEGLRLPFVAVYGILQPVLPATLVVPTIPIWKVIYVLRAIGWYALLPLMILSFVTGSGSGLGKTRTLFVWLSLLAWTWILLAALRGGGDQWDNPRYRTLLFAWQALIAGVAWAWWRETRSLWFTSVVACEGVFILVFTQWYASRYFYVGGQLPFPAMIALIVGLWGAILGTSWWLGKKRV